jgi:predicted nuclease of predicted toxin-antitoxin system
MRFLLDEDLSPKAAEIARGLGLDVVSVHEIARRGLPDLDQLRFSASVGRICLTRNRNDFMRLTQELYEAGEVSHGVLIVPRSLPNSQPERIAHALKRWADARRGWEGVWLYGIDFLSA